MHNAVKLILLNEEALLGRWFAFSIQKIEIQVAFQQRAASLKLRSIHLKK